MLIAGNILVTRPDWFARRDPRCNSDNQHLFFPRQGQSATAAKTICADCAVVQQCYRWALDDHGLEGVFGGTTTAERDRIRQARNAA